MTAELSPKRSDPATQVFDGFISYSHSADDLLAPRVQAGLQQFAKPWWKRRAVRIFRDESSLSANPHLWSSITEALDQSGWFVLLLSPQAAASQWVNQEVEYWLEHKDPDRIIPVLTAGDFTWSDHDFVSDAAPPALQGAFSDEPRWVDLRFARTEEQLDLQNPQFSAAIADVASAIRGVPKDELESEEVHQHRRTVRTAWAAGVALLVLVVLASAGAIVAVGQTNEAQAQRDNAERQTAIASENEQRATAEAERANQESDRANQLAEQAQQQAELARSRELAASAINVLDDDPELSVLLSLQAARGADPTFESVSALHQALLNHRTISVFPSLTATDKKNQNPLDSPRLSPDGRFVARPNANTVMLVDISTGEQRWSRAWSEELNVYDVDFTADGESVVVTVVNEDPGATPGPEEGVWVLDISDGAESRIDVDLPCPPLTVVGTAAGLVPFGDMVITAPTATGNSASPCDWGLNRVFAVGADGTARLLLPDTFPISSNWNMSVSGDGKRLAIGALVTKSDTEVFEVATGAPVFSVPGGYVAALDFEGTRLLAGGGFDDLSVTLWDVTTGKAISNFDRHEGATFWAFFVGDGERVLSVGGDSTLRLWEAANANELVVVRGVKGLIFGHSATSDGSRALSVGSDGVRLWNLAGNGEIRSIELPRWSYPSNGAAIVGTDGAMYLFGGASSIYHFDARTGAVEQRFDIEIAGQSIALSPDGERLAVQSVIEGAIGPVHVLDNRTGNVLTEVEGMCTYIDEPDGNEDCVPLPDTPFEEWIWNLSFSPDGTKLASGGGSRSATVWDAETGSLEWNSGLLAGPDDSWVTVAFDPTGQLLAYAGFEQITLVGAQDYAPINSRSAEAQIRHMAFTPDGELLVVATLDSNIIWYDTDSLEEAGRFDAAHDGFIQDLDVAASGLVVTGGSDGFARVWDLQSAQLLQAIPFDDVVQNVVVLNDSELFVTPFHGPGLVVALDIGELIEIARQRVTRSFTPRECEIYHIDPCPTLEDIKRG